VTHRANGWAGAHEGLPREKLLSMTTDAGIVVWKVSYIRKIALCRPGSGNFVTGIAGETLVFVG